MLTFCCRCETPGSLFGELPNPFRPVTEPLVTSGLHSPSPTKGTAPSQSVTGAKAAQSCAHAAVPLPTIPTDLIAPGAPAEMPLTPALFAGFGIGALYATLLRYANVRMWASPKKQKNVVITGSARGIGKVPLPRLTCLTLPLAPTFFLSRMGSSPPPPSPPPFSLHLV